MEGRGIGLLLRALPWSFVQREGRNYMVTMVNVIHLIDYSSGV